MGTVTMNIVVTGVKGSGKSTIGRLLAHVMGSPFVDLDDVVVQRGRERFGETMSSCAEIYRTAGELTFRRLEIEAAREIDGIKTGVLATGGSTMMTPVVRKLLGARGTFVFLNANADCLWKRVVTKGIPSYLEQHTAPEEAFYRRSELIRSTVMPLCKCIAEVENKAPLQIVADILKMLDLDDVFWVSPSGPKPIRDRCVRT